MNSTYCSPWMQKHFFQFPLLTNQEVCRLVMLWKQKYDRNARHTIIITHTRLIWKVATKLIKNTVSTILDAEDLIIAGMEGLDRAMRTFKGYVTFITFAQSIVYFKMLREIMKNRADVITTINTNRNNASAVFLTRTSFDEIIKKVHAPEVFRNVEMRLDCENLLKQLTEKERKVMMCLAFEYSGPKIAKLLNVSNARVYQIRDEVQQKLAHV